MGEVAKQILWPAENPAVIAHMNILQTIINRLATQSSSCKTWCLTLFAALLSFAGATKTPDIVAFALVPVAVFGFLDAMYLAQEKAYRRLFENIAESIRNGNYNIDRLFTTSAPRDNKHVLHALLSWSIWPVYGGLLFAYIISYYNGWLSALTSPARGV